MDPPGPGCRARGRLLCQGGHVPDWLDGSADGVARPPAASGVDGHRCVYAVVGSADYGAFVVNRPSNVWRREPALLLLVRERRGGTLLGGWTAQSRATPASPARGDRFAKSL